MQLKQIELTGFKSFAKKTALSFDTPVTGIVGPNGSGKSNVVEAIRFVLGEQSIKSLRGKGGADLVFKGSKMIPASSRAKVVITFDNKKRAFSFQSGTQSINLDFDEVTIGREVFADGTNKYSINGTDVRLKDVLELVASVNIGSSGHHIISQGEADRLLSSSSKDRRAMVEDALGLRVYQYRIRESERKLEKTESNMKEVASLRREIAPHISFLKKQVEKIEKARELTGELQNLYKDYFSREAGYINIESEALSKSEEMYRNELASIEKILAEKTLTVTSDDASSALLVIEQKQRELLRKKDDLQRALGRIEGAIGALRESVTVPKEEDETLLVPLVEVEGLASIFDKISENIESLDDISTIKQSISNFRQSLRQFVDRYKTNTKPITSNSSHVQEKIQILGSESESIILELEKLLKEEEAIQREAILLREQNEKREASRFEKERERYELKAKHNELLSRGSVLSLKREALQKLETDFTEEIHEANVLVGASSRSFTPISFSENPGQTFRTEQEDLRKKIERIKIKLEDAGISSGSDIVKEYEETVSRDQFLSRELEDLEKSSHELSRLIRELKETLDKEFKIGVEKINREFQEYFSKMFGGGTALLSIVVEHKRPTKEGEEEDLLALQEELEFERGLEINVSLPHKKVRDLHMLSGGERSLTSIALLFAMSQVNPPPFLVLDETDAALDEANSRKYGDMIEMLSRSSELILVTHNRETMSRAQVLYGVTIGADGGSKILSIKFEEAVKIAK